MVSAAARPVSGLTRFFRNTAQLQAFAHHVLPLLAERKRRAGERTVRVWSAGCSTGEEAYTLAILLREALPADFTACVYATDVDDDALQTARAAVYARSSLRGTPETYLSRWFTCSGRNWRVSDEVRQLVRFSRHDVRCDGGPREVDAVFCRNLLLYFDTPTRRAVLRRLREAMAEGTWLFVGGSESLRGVAPGLVREQTPWCVVYRKGPR